MSRDDDHNISQELLRLKKEKLDRLLEEERIRRELPHLHSHKFYPWMREFWENYTNKILIITACNQVGKSSVLIRKMIELATNKELWPIYWPDLPEHNPVPSQFWYCYPSRDVATIEWYEKWAEYMPRNQEDPVYGWKVNLEHGKIHSVDFKSGVSIYFKTYAQDVHMLQSGTVHLLGGDEEMPAELFPELSMRVNSTDGYLYFVFTATRGQEFWRQVVERRSTLTEAKIWQVSLYDCQYYDDGSATKWTSARIEQAISRCSNKAEIDRRIMGKFVLDSGRKYSGFDREVHLVKPFNVPPEWSRWVGIDVGSGGESGHPAAISFVAVNPNHTLGVVYKFWRGDGVTTTAQDIVNKYIDLSQGEPSHTVYYDWASADFKNIALSQGLPVVKAEKSHTLGENTMNTLFSFNMLQIFHTEEGEKLCTEFENLLESTNKKHAKDDGIDSLRYAIVPIAWNFNDVSQAKIYASKPIPNPVDAMDDREKFSRGIIDKQNQDAFVVEDELAFWSDQMEGY